MRPYKYYKNRARQKVTVQVMNRPWRSFVITLITGMVLGGAATLLFTTLAR